MQRVGQVAIYAGIGLIAIGLLVGFPVMLTGSKGAVPWLGLVPVGFLSLMIGITISLLR